MSDVFSPRQEVRFLRSSSVLENATGLPKMQVLQERKEFKASETGNAGYLCFSSSAVGSADISGYGYSLQVGEKNLRQLDWILSGNASGKPASFLERSSWTKPTFAAEGKVNGEGGQPGKALFSASLNGKAGSTPNSLKRYGKHYTLKKTREFVRKWGKRNIHINGIEGFWSFAKHGLYNYRGVSKSMFPLYLKEMEYRYNHRKDNLLQLLIHLYFSGKSA